MARRLEILVLERLLSVLPNPKPGCLESDNYGPGITDGTLPKTFLGNPTKRAYDYNLAGGARWSRIGCG